MILNSKIAKTIPGKGFYLAVSFPDTKKLRDTKIEVHANDGTQITTQQRRHIYALYGDISEYTGYMPDMVKTLIMALYLQDKGIAEFSLSDCPLQTANEYLDWLIAYCIEHSIPLKSKPQWYAPDLGKMIYACTIKKVCCCCGAKADLHHADAVGMGRDRDEINHIGMRVMPLCRKHHTACHTMPQADFESKYHIIPVKVTGEIAKNYNLKVK